MGLDSLLNSLGFGKKKLPKEILSQIRGEFAKLQGLNARTALPECEQMIQVYSRKYDVAEFEKQIEIYRTLLNPEIKISQANEEKYRR